MLQGRFLLFLEALLRQGIDLLGCGQKELALDVFLGLLGPQVNLLDALAVAQPPRDEQLVDQVLAELLGEDRVDLVIVEESDLPIFVAEALREVLEARALQTGDVI